MSFNPKDKWTKEVSAFHPWKMASPKGRREFLRAIAGVDPAVGMLFPETVQVSWREWVQGWADYVRWELARFRRYLEGKPL